MNPLPPTLRRAPLHVAVGTSCGNACLFCMEGQSSPFARNRSVRTPAEMEKLLDRNRGFSSVDFVHREPTDNPNIPHFIAAAAKRGFSVIRLTTNGRRLSRMDYLRTLVENGLTAVTISCHGHTDRIHDTLTATEGSFRETVQGLRNVAELRRLGSEIRFVTTTVVTKLNDHHVLDMLHFFRTVAPDIVQFTFPQVFGRMLPNFDALMPRYSDVIPVFRQASEAGCGQNFVVSEIPLCVAIHLPAANVACRTAKTFVDDRCRVVRSKERDFQRTVRRPGCAECLMQDRCDGIWPRYAQVYGWDEFKPVTDAQFRNFLVPQGSPGAACAEQMSGLLAPLLLGQEILHWRWSGLDATSEGTLLYFRHSVAGTLILRILPRSSNAECYATSANYRVSYDGSRLTPLQQLFLDFVVARIRENDPYCV